MRCDLTNGELFLGAMRTYIFHYLDYSKTAGIHLLSQRKQFFYAKTQVRTKIIKSLILKDDIQGICLTKIRQPAICSFRINQCGKTKEQSLHIMDADPIMFCYLLAQRLNICNRCVFVGLS